MGSRSSLQLNIGRAKFGNEDETKTAFPRRFWLQIRLITSFCGTTGSHCVSTKCSLSSVLRIFLGALGGETGFASDCIPALTPEGKLKTEESWMYRDRKWAGSSPRRGSNESSANAIDEIWNRLSKPSTQLRAGRTRSRPNWTIEIQFQSARIRESAWHHGYPALWVSTPCQVHVR